MPSISAQVCEAPGFVNEEEIDVLLRSLRQSQGAHPVLVRFRVLARFRRIYGCLLLVEFLLFQLSVEGRA